MKCVLIRPRYFSVWEALGLGYVGAYIKKHEPDIELRFFDGFFDSDEQTIRGCKDADVVGVSATSPQMKHGLSLAREIKLVNPNVWVVIGGWHPSGLPMETVKNPEVDTVVVGEGEESMLKILKGNRDKILWSEPIQDLDSLPWPDRELIKVERTIALTEKNDGERITSAQGGRGCPFSCIFCGEKIISDRKVRRRSPNNLLDEIEFVVDKYKIDLLKFVDPEINVWKRWVKEFCLEAIKRNVDVEFEANIHASNVDLDMFMLMKKAGFRQVDIGAESGSPRILKEIKKGLTIEQIVRAFDLAKKAGLRRRAYFMIGMPSEDTTDVAMTFKLAERLNADVYGMTIMAPYPGTEIYDVYKDADINWEVVDEYSNPYTKTQYLTNEDLKYYQRRFVQKFKGHLAWRHKVGSALDS